MLKTFSMLRATPLIEDASLGGADCILHMEVGGTISTTGVWDVSLDF